MIYGSIEKVRKNHLNELEQCIGIKFEEIVDIDFLGFLTTYIEKYQTNIGFTLDKDNKVEYIFVADFASLPLDNKENTQPNGKLFLIVNNENFKLSNIEKSFLKKKRLEMLCKVGYVGNLKGAEIAFLNVDEIKIMQISSIEYINKYGIDEKLVEYRENYRESLKQGYATGDEIQKAILVGIGRRGEDIDVWLDELQGLAQTDGFEVVAQFKQTRKKADNVYHIGAGKLEELRDLIAETDANVVIFDDELSGNKIKNLEDELDVKVMDRANIILDIFAKRAKSNEGRLQVSLAQMKYNFGRVNAFQNTVSRGLGMRGVGETQMELNRRLLKNKIYGIEKQIEELKRQRELRRAKRKEKSEKVVALVGYTNAGKSTLLNKMTNAEALAEDMLFATLDTMTRECYLDTTNKVLLTDTVGFIDKLPHEFIDAFSATLEESIESNLLLIVVDISDPDCQRKYEVVLETLRKINANNIPSVVVLNKSDANATYELNTSKQTIQISAKTGEGLPQLRKIIKQYLF